MQRSVLALLSLVSALAVAPAPAQQARYFDAVFTGVDVSRDLTYGSALNRYTQQVETLQLDLYQPRGDDAPRRAAVVVVHGGGFVSGDKASLQFRRLCTHLAERGYLAVSINYRLAPRGTAVGQPVITDAAHDFKAAVRYLRRNARTYHIDTGRIACLGSSAGAFTVLDGAYVPGEGSSGNPGFSSRVHAVVDLWGGILDVTNLEAGEAPLCIIHGTSDPVVTYQYAIDLQARAALVGVPNVLYPLQGLGHAPWGTVFSSYLDDIDAFLYEHLCLVQLAGLAARPGYASPGSLTIDNFGLAGDAWFLSIATGTGNLPLGQLGVLCLDLSSTIAVANGSLPATPQVATDNYALTVPVGLAGATFYWQAVQVTPAFQLRSLSNCVTTGF